jgi:hypothetical protein
MPRKINKLAGDFVVLKNPPETLEQQAYAKSLGFRRLRSGQWVRPDVPINPSLEMLQKYGPGHTCKACKGFFRSKVMREQYCPSCRGIIDHTAKQLTDMLQAASQGSFDLARSALAAIEEALTCTFPTGPRTHCGWHVPIGSQPSHSLIIRSLPRWVAKAHCHHLRHVYFNRFPYSKKFFPYVESEAEKKAWYREYYDTKWQRKLARDRGVPAIEIDYPE